MEQSKLDEAVVNLLETAEKILKLKSDDNPFATKKEKKKSSKDPLKKFLENYKEDYFLSDEDGNKEDIIHAYQKYRGALLRGWKNDIWLRNGSVAIFSGAIEPDEKRKIPLSSIYNLACKIRDDRRASLADLPVEAYDGVEELLYASFFQLYMYRVFLFSLDGEEYGDDITKLGLNVGELEKELGITASSLVPAGGGQDLLSGMGDGLLGFATDMASKLGVNLPEGMDLQLNQESLMNVVSNFASNPALQDLVQDLGDSMKGAKDISEALPKALGKFNDPVTRDKFGKIFSGMGGQAGVLTVKKED